MKSPRPAHDVIAALAAVAIITMMTLLLLMPTAAEAASVVVVGGADAPHGDGFTHDAANDGRKAAPDALRGTSPPTTNTATTEAETVFQNAPLLLPLGAAGCLLLALVAWIAF